MKTFVKLKDIFLVLVLLLVASSTGFSQNIPLTKNIEIKASSPELSKEIAAFSGKWKGKWDRGEDFILVVTEIGSEKAEIIYANADAGVVDRACDYVTAKVILGGNPKIQFNRSIWVSSGHAQFLGWYTFEMQKDLKTLKGVLEWQRGTPKAILEKIE